MMKVLRGVLVLVAVSTLVGCRGADAKLDTPDGAIRNMQQAVLANDPQQIFAALPASYQTDVDGLVADAAKRMDAELWNESKAVLKQVAGLLKSKRDLLLANQMMASVPNKADIEKNWDTGVDLLQALIDSEFGSLERLRQGNVKGLLSGDGARIMAKITKMIENSDSGEKAAEGLDTLKAAKVSLVSQDGDTAVVKIEVPEKETETVDMIKVEGVWIPKDMADGFKEGIAEARKNLAKMDFTSEAGKQQRAMAMMQLGAIKPMLAQLEAAKTQEDLQAVMGGVMMMMMGGMQQGGGMPPPSME